MCLVMYYYFVHYIFYGEFLVFHGQKTNLSLLLSWLGRQVFDLLSESLHILVRSLSFFSYILFV